MLAMWRQLIQIASKSSAKRSISPLAMTARSSRRSRNHQISMQRRSSLPWFSRNAFTSPFIGVKM